MKHVSRSRVMAFTIVMMSVLMIVGLHAQGRMMKPEERAKQLQEQLSLSDEQTANITKIFEALQEEMMKMMGSFQGDREAARQAMQDVTLKTDKKIEALLTKEQKKQYEELKKKRQQRLRSREQR